MLFRSEDVLVLITEHGLAAVRSIRFQTYALNIDLAEMLPTGREKQRKPEEMYFHELLEAKREAGPFGRGKEYNSIVLEMMERLAVPLAVFLMGLVGASLGAQVKSRGRVVGGAIGLVVFLAYYFCWAGCRSLSETGLVAPEIGPWIPVALLTLASVYLLRQAVYERPLVILGRTALLRGRGGGGRGPKPLGGPDGRTFEERAGHGAAEERPADTEASATILPVPVDLAPGRVGRLTLGRYVGNMRTGKYHVRTCRWASVIAEEDRFCFLHREEAEAAGYVPCKVCRPWWSRKRP